MPRSELPWLVVSGTALAIHFAAFVGSLSLTSVSSAVLIATSAPIFIGFASRQLAGDRVPPVTVVAIGLSLAGGAVLALGDLNSGATRLSGDLLALVAALAALPTTSSGDASDSGRLSFRTLRSSTGPPRSSSWP